MAVMARGRVQLEGAPAELIKRTRGRICTKATKRTKLQRNKKLYSLGDVYLSTVALSHPAA
jgi:hypothetical protein